MDRQKIEERDTFTYEEKQRIALKSNNKCCHCGKEVYFGYGATIDHFIPLSKGGTNDNDNLIMLCKNCNDAKKNLVVLPHQYIKHLNEEHYQKLKQYVDKYMHNFEYVSRQNLLSYDTYDLYFDVTAPSVRNSHKGHKRNQIYRPKKATIKVQRATIDDIPRLVDYMYKYLQKYTDHTDKNQADIAIRFWYQFGCIYYMEINNEIQVLTAAIAADEELGSSRHIEPVRYISISVFPYYDTDRAYSLCIGILTMLPQAIAKEQKIPELFFIVTGFKRDKIMAGILSKFGTKRITIDRGNIIQGTYTCESPEPDEADPKNMEKFFDKFPNIEKEVTEWLEGKDELRWLMTGFSVIRT